MHGHVATPPEWWRVSSALEEMHRQHRIAASWCDGSWWYAHPSLADQLRHGKPPTVSLRDYVDDERRQLRRRRTRSSGTILSPILFSRRR